MDDAIDRRPFPRAALFGAAALISLALALAAAGRLTGIGTTALPPSPLVAAHDLRFEDRADGAVVVSAWPDGRTVYIVEPGTGGFVRGVLRGLARERKRQDIGVDPPFRLQRWADGRLSIVDTATGQKVDFGAFGPTNAQDFVRMFEAREGRS